MQHKLSFYFFFEICTKWEVMFLLKIQVSRKSYLSCKLHEVFICAKRISFYETLLSFMETRKKFIEINGNELRKLSCYVELRRTIFFVVFNVFHSYFRYLSHLFWKDFLVVKPKIWIQLTHRNRCFGLYRLETVWYSVGNVFTI